MIRICCVTALAVVLSACVAEPPMARSVVTLRASERVPTEFPAPGTVWRLDSADLNALSPAPIIEAPPPPNWPPPPRPGEYWGPPADYYPPAYGTFWYQRRW